MELHHLRYFLAVADHHGFSRAAEALSLAQPSLSRQIGDLERELGAPLFNRSGRAISLTAAGAALLPAARAALDEAERGRLAVREVVGAQAGPLSIGSSPQTAATILAPVLASWWPRHPGVEIRLVEEGALELIAMLEDGRLDLAVVPIDVPPSLTVVPFLSAQVQVLVRPDHCFAARRSLDLRELVAAPGAEPIRLLMLKERYLTRLRLTIAWEEAGLRPYIAMESAVGQTLAAYAEAGLGVAVLPATVDLRGFTLARVVVTDGGKPLVLRNGIGWNPRRYLSPAGQVFVRALCQQHAAVPPPR